MLVELLNDILDLSKFEAGQLELEAIPFDLGVLVEDTASLLSQNAAPGVELSCLIDPRMPSLVVGDPTRVRQIVSNLLSNALKFTRFGRVDLRVTPTAEGVTVSVRDTGIGISSEAMPKLFQPFAQAGAGITRQFGGTGLGLALTRRLCETMNGKLHVRSEEGIGSLFSAELPLASHADATPAPALQGASSPCAPQAALAELLKTWLPAWGINYQRRDVDTSLAGQVFDQVITDSPEHLQRLRGESTAPILLITGYGTSSRANRPPRSHPCSSWPDRWPARRSTRRCAAACRPSRTNPPHADTQAAPGALGPRAAGGRQCGEPAGGQGHARQAGLRGVDRRPRGEALQMLAEEPVDLVLMDCNMPIMDGYEATRRIRQSGNWPGLPIVALTANALPDERERCRAAGMDDYLAKPFRREELVALLDNWLPATQPTQ